MNILGLLKLNEIGINGRKFASCVVKFMNLYYSVI